MIKSLEFKDLYIGLKVVNSHGDIGIIIACDDIHNIHVQYGEGEGDGGGLYCLDTNCVDDYEPLYNV